MNTNVDPGRVLPVQGVSDIHRVWVWCKKNFDNSAAMAKVIIWLLCILSVVFFSQGKSDSTSEVRILHRSIFITPIKFYFMGILDFSSSSCSEKGIPSEHGI